LVSLRVVLIIFWARISREKVARRMLTNVGLLAKLLHVCLADRLIIFIVIEVNIGRGDASLAYILVQVRNIVSLY
jgi:hypothetical protein